MTAARGRALWWGIAALALAGAGISGYLTFTHWTEEPVLCAGLGSCATVQSSEYAEVGGVPVALVGLLAYVTIGGLALAAAGRPWAQLVLFGVALSGVLYSGYLTWVELAVLEAICLWCVASALVITAITALVLAAVVLPQASTPAAPARAAWLRRGA